MAPFTHLYPFEFDQVMDIAYYFEFDYADGRGEDDFATETLELLRRWMADPARGAVSLSAQPDGTLCILDTRREYRDAPRRARLDGWKAAVYLACDRAQPLRVLTALPEVVEAGVSTDEIVAFLERCVAHRLMVRGERAWLNVAVHVPAREPAAEPVLAGAGAGTTASQS
jgi:hypothetical protein